MGVRAGNFNRRIVIQSFTVGRNEVGEEIKTWATWKTVWAEMLPEKGDETFQSDRRVATQTVKFRIRFLAGVGPDKQILFEGKTFEIVDVAETRRREELVLTATVLDAAAGA